MGKETVQSAPQTEWLARLRMADNYNRWIFNTILPHLSGRVLEIGCGTGTVSDLIAAAVDHLIAIDIDAAFVDSARVALKGRRNVTVSQADATRDLPDGIFDVVVMLDVLEHIADDLAMLRALAVRLNASGRILLKVPALPALLNSQDIAVGHFRRYDRRALETVAVDAGLAIDRIVPFNIAGILGWWWNGQWGKAVAPKTQINIFDRLVPMLERFERVVAPPVGLSYFAVLSKRSEQVRLPLPR